MAESSFRPQPRPRNALDYEKFKLRAEVPNHKGKFASLVWEFVGQNPRIKVYTNDPNDQDNDYGQIKAKMDGQNCKALIEKIRDAIAFKPTEAQPEWESFSMENMDGWNKEKRCPDIVASETKVGRDKQGIWIAVIDKRKQNRPRIRFYFGHYNDFHRYKHADGSDYSKEEASVLFARGYINLLDRLIDHLTAAADFTPREKKGGQQGNRQGGGGGGGNYNRGNGSSNRSYGGGSNEQSEDMTGEDIPW